jgi:hypothetical protein
VDDKNLMGMLGAEIVEIDLGGDWGEEEHARGPMTPEERAQAVIGEALDDAIEFYEENLEPDQVLATDYYYGRPFGNEKDNRSKVVSTAVRDAVLTQLPDLLRLFFGPESPVELEPDTPEQMGEARKATQYVRKVFMEENPGFLESQNVLKDGLVRRIGAFKWFWDEETVTEQQTFQGLTEQEIVLLSSEVDDYEILSSENDDLDGQVHDVSVTINRKEGRARVVAVPPEELVWTPNAPRLGSAPMIAHVREVRVDELLDMGIDQEVVDRAVGKQAKDRSDKNLKSARQFHEGAVSKGSMLDDDELDENGPKVQRPVLFAEAYAKLVDANGDGISELRRFDCVGPNWEIVNGKGLGEVVDEIPIAIFTPDPEPHTMVGLSTFDLLKSNQEIMSQIERANLNALARAVEPPTEVVQGEVNLKDLLSPDINGLVRVRRPGMMREIASHYPDVFPSLSYYNDKKQKQVGISDASAGLDPDTLQSTTRAGVAATVSGARARTEYIARVFAETCFKPMFRGLFRLIQANQSATQTMMSGRMQEVDPAVWSPDMRVTINVALGMGSPEDRMAILAGFADKLDLLMQQGSPLVSRVHQRNVFAKAVSLAGFDPSLFLNEWTEEQEQQYQQMMQQQAEENPPQDPGMMLVQVEAQKVQGQLMIDQQKLELEKWKAQMEDDRARDKLARDSILKEMEIEAKNQVELQDRMVKSRIEEERVRLDADIKAQAEEAKATVALEAARNQPPAGA